MNDATRQLIKEARKQVVGGSDKEKYLFDPEYHAWVTRCANAAEMGVRLAANALEESEKEKERWKDLAERWKDLALRAGDKIATAVGFAEDQRNRADVLQGLTLHDPEKLRADAAEARLAAHMNSMHTHDKQEAETQGA